MNTSVVHICLFHFFGSSLMEVKMKPLVGHNNAATGIMKNFIAAHTFFLCVSILSISMLSFASDTLLAGESIKPGQTLVSASGVFELGFFTPDNSMKQYVGIWYKMSNSTVVWLANRENPVVKTPGIFGLTEAGILTISDRDGTLIWLSNSSSLSRNSPSADLLDSGNFVVKDGDSSNQDDILWQGFDYPCDTQLPGMKIGRDLIRKRDVYLSSWKSNNDPAVGDVTYKLDTDGVPQFFLRKGSAKLFRRGPWNGIRFSGGNNLNLNPDYNFSYVSDQEGIYYNYEPFDSSVILRTAVTPNGLLQRFMWNEKAEYWTLYITYQTDNCDNYSWCGSFAVCNINNSASCKCLKGFLPKSQDDWDRGNWSSGCVRRTALNCTSGDGFFRYSRIKVPDTRSAWSNKNMSLDECRISCLKNCSCTAYADLDIRNGGSGCLLWFGKLDDMREYADYGRYIYIKLASSDIGQAGSNVYVRQWITISSVLGAGIIFLGLVLSIYVTRRRKQNLERRGRRYKGINYKKDDLELPLYEFDTIAKATNNFSQQNKLGEGGFGPVFKGVLKCGQEIAVKRLSSDSKQGLDEFMNEALCIVKLQHRNLVKLLGCCIDEEKMLVYEHMGNRSLDIFIFDEKRSELLDWPKRFNIINGIARGLLYLHQDSTLRIIHRDLKASNILLDYEMNPKISDFGMAKSIGLNETSSSTTTVVGTYGYMPPEYAIHGIFSVKSDVFSYGVLLLEIVSQRRNRGFSHKDHPFNLLGHAWMLYRDGKLSELIDNSVSDSVNLAEIIRAAHIGLLCVQRRPDDRPSMSNVVLMLSSDIKLPEPKEPGFFMPVESDSFPIKPECRSSNGMSITLMNGR